MENEVKISLTKGRIIKEIREDVEKELTVFYQRPVKVNIFVVHRHHKSIEELNAENDQD